MNLNFIYIPKTRIDTIKPNTIQKAMMKIYESAEHYLETILSLKERLGHVRAIDIVRNLNYSKPSVSNAMKRLRENKLIFVDGEGYITLSPEGLDIALRIYGRHQLLTQFFISIGVDATTAEADACRAEHVLSDETIEKIKEHAKKCLRETPL